MSSDAKIVAGAGLIVLLSIAGLIAAGVLEGETSSLPEPAPTASTVPPAPMPQVDSPRVLSPQEAATTFSLAGGLGAAALALGAARALTERLDTAVVHAAVVTLAAASATTVGYIAYESGRAEWWIIPAASTLAGAVSFLISLTDS